MLQIQQMRSQNRRILSFLLLALTVISVSTCPQNCAFCNQDQSVCTLCSVSHQPASDGKCYNGIANCQLYLSQKLCFMCKPTFKMSSDSTKCQKNYNNLGCINMIQQCLECGFGLELLNGSCKGIINCRQYDSIGKCKTCSSDYTLKDNICMDQNLSCKYHDIKNGLCLQCQPGYIMSGYRCFKQAEIDPLCSVLQAPNKCMICKKDYELNPYGKCIYRLGPVGPVNDQICVKRINDKCQECAKGFYLSADRTCKALPPRCHKADIRTGKCLICIQDYQIIQPSSACIKKDTYCADFNEALSQCIQCISGFYKNQFEKCVPLPSFCAIANPQGVCTSCKTGYNLSSDKVCSVDKSSPEVKTSQSPFFKDPHCKRERFLICQQCSQKYYLKQGKCTRVNPLCKENDQQGNCTSCFVGYRVVKGLCVFDQNLTDPFCRKYLLPNETCASSQCYSGYYFSLSTKKCTMINPLCKTVHPENGTCASCYLKFTLNKQNGVCMSSYAYNCQQVGSNNVCLKCANRTFRDSNGDCIPLNQLCKQSDPVNGQCTACYRGYVNQNGSCVVASKLYNNCKRFSGICLQCFAGYFVNDKGVCRQVDPLCKTYSFINGACLTCYKGYQIKGNSCERMENHCKRGTTGFCSECYTGYVPINGTCIQISPLCMAVNTTTGLCNQCWYAYTNENGICKQYIPQQQIFLPFCQEEREGVCYECVSRYFLNQKKQCESIPLLCESFNKTSKKCLSCIQGYFYQDQQCVYPTIYDPKCIRYEDTYCSHCMPGYYIDIGYTCQPIDKNCEQFNHQQNVCIKCANKYRPQGAICN